MKDSKFLGVCILVSGGVLALAILAHAFAGRQTGRYQFAPSNPPGVIWILDTTTGKVKTQSG